MHRLLAASLFFFAFPALAQTDAGRPPYVDSDWALMPQWCIDTQDGPHGSPSYRSNANGRNRSPRSDEWTALFGRDFWHMHHFCRALYAERRIGIPGNTPLQRAAAATKAIGDFLYVIRTCQPSMPLMPEVYYRLGDVYLRTGERVKAAEAFEASRRAKPDYWPAYTRWADELAALRMLDSAIALIDEGLRHAPAEAQLLERKRRFAQRAAGLPAGRAAPHTGSSASSSASATRP